MNRTLFNNVRCMSFFSSLPTLSWSEAIMIATCLVKLSLSNILNFNVLKQAWYGKRPHCLGFLVMQPMLTNHRVN